MDLNRYTNTELADIHFIYGLANLNGRVVIWLYGERYPARRQPNDLTFNQVHPNLAEHGSFRIMIDGTGLPLTVRTPIFEEGVLHAVRRNPSTSVRALAVAHGRLCERAVITAR
ncbi:hypothetical protein TNCV_3188531 [Trichonephila clavipes]|nr:hypothetical protein TNCV_3188531 [Trichonephila clavipes]